MINNEIESSRAGKDSTAATAAAPFEFLCKLPSEQQGTAYHVVVGFHDASQRQPANIRFTSFVGAGRRSFAVWTVEAPVQDGAFSTPETLIRLAIAQALRDHLYDKAREGDCALDWAVDPWDGPLIPVGLGAGRKVRSTVSISASS